MIKISPRLTLVSEFIKKNSYVLDVGTDHGLLPMYLVEKGIVKKAVASDVVPSIVEKTKAKVKENKLDDKIKVVLSDGLKDIKESSIDTIVIAGMGGILTVDILKARTKYLKGKTLILSPHRDVDLVRKYLHQIGFKITKEEILEDREDKFYTIIKAVEGKDTYYSELDYKLGKKLISSKKRNLEFEKYLKHLIKKNETITDKLKNSKKESNRIEELKLETLVLKELLKEERHKVK